MRRRTVLAGMGGVFSGFLPGCLSASSPSRCGAADLPAEGFIVSNLDGVEHRLSITVTYELLLYSNTVFSETIDLPPVGGADSRRRFDDVARTAGPHVVQARLGNGASATYLWRVTPDECDPIAIAIRDGEVMVTSLL